METIRAGTGEDQHTWVGRIQAVSTGPKPVVLGVHREKLSRAIGRTDQGLPWLGPRASLYVIV